MIARCGNCHCTIKDGDKVYYILDIGDAYDKVYIPCCSIECAEELKDYKIVELEEELREYKESEIEEDVW